MKPLLQALPGPGEEASWCSFLVLCCYTMCTMKAPPQALERPGEKPSWHLPFHGIYGIEGPAEEPSWHLPFHGIYGLLSRLHGVPVWCSVLYNIHHEGSSHLPFNGIYGSTSPGPSRAWRGGFMVFLFGARCYTICTMKAPPQVLPGPGEEPSWHLFLVSVMFYKIGQILL